MWYVAVAFTSGDLKSVGKIFRPGDGPYTDEQLLEWFSDSYSRTMKDMGFLVVQKIKPLVSEVSVVKTPVLSEDGDVVEAPKTVPYSKPISYPQPMAPERENIQRTMPVKVVEDARLPLIEAKAEVPTGKRGRKAGK